LTQLQKVEVMPAGTAGPVAALVQVVAMALVS
jgi:hypothetical protein